MGFYITASSTLIDFKGVSTHTRHSLANKIDYLAHFSSPTAQSSPFCSRLVVVLVIPSFLFEESRFLGNVTLKIASYMPLKEIVHV